jgi:hypothetical protein
LEEAAVVRVLRALAKPDALEAMWTWEHPLAGYEALLAAAAKEADE